MSLAPCQCRAGECRHPGRSDCRRRTTVVIASDYVEDVFTIEWLDRDGRESDWTPGERDEK